MGILFSTTNANATKAPAGKTRPSNDLLHQLKCRACPLNKAKHLMSPKMEPTGSNKPLIYIIGEAPGQIEDEEGEQFHPDAPSGSLIRPLVKEFKNQIRWSNVLRCRPQNNRNPEEVEIECCRPFLESSIEESRPEAIIALGGFALSWAGMPYGIELWRGRRFPVRVGQHECWFYPTFHPAFLLHSRKKTGADGSQYTSKHPSDYEIAFRFDIKRALREIDEGLPRPVIHTAKDARENITCITGRSSKDLRYVLEFLDYAGSCDDAGVDYETQNIRPYRPNSKILTKAVSVKDETLAFAWRHKEAGWTENDFDKLTKAWLRFLRSKARKAVHNLSFELEWTAFFYGNEYVRDCNWHDTLTGAYILDERSGDKKALSLEFVSLENFGLNIKKLTRPLNKDRMDNEPLDVILPYNGIDAKYHRLNFVVQQDRIKKEGLVEVYEEKLEQVPTVVLSQIKGIPVNIKENRKLSAEYNWRIKKALDHLASLPEVRKFETITKEKFNPGSVQHVVSMLRDVFKTREGQPGTGWSTTEDVLSKIDTDVTKGILAYRKVTKLKSTYVDPYSPESQFVYPGNIIHTNFGTCYTETGRLNSDGPNVQNVPIRSEDGKRARRQIGKPKGITASFDYGQIDARGIACGSRDPYYCKALFEDFDIHFEWAERLAYHYPAWVGGKKYLKDEAVLKKFRSGKVKNQFVFALFYGAALSTTAHRFGVDQDIMKPMYEDFWKQFALVKDWQEKVIKEFEQTGSVQLFGGLKRRAPLGHGQIINSPIQGATNRITMDAMNRLSKAGYQANMQIHDDLTFFFDTENEFYDAAPTIIDMMLDGRAFPWFCVPLVVELKIGTLWADTKEVAVYNSYNRLKWPQRAKEFM